MIKGIIFDLDGIITDTAAYHFLAWKQLCDEENLDFDKEVNEQLKGVSRKKSLEIILKHNNKTLSEAVEKSYLERKNTYYTAYLDKVTESDYLPGIQSLLQQLKSSNFKIALGSASKNAHLVLEKLNATSFFDVIGDGNSVKNPKPAPDLFTYVARELGLTPQECIVIEDAAPGIKAAQEAKMKAIGIGDKEILGEAEIVLEHTELLTIDRIKKLEK